jgi:ABC-2 type transport system permease protein
MTSGWHVVIRAMRIQMVTERLPAFLLGVAFGPLTAVVPMLMARGAGREDALAYVVFAPFVSSLWGGATLASGAAVSFERSAGTLELLVSSPTRPWVPIFGRVVATTVVSLFAVPETFLVAWLLGISIPVADPFIFVIAMVAFSLSTVGAGMAMANFFVLTRSASLWANLFGFPFFILAAASFPITLLPGVVQPLSYLVAMYWTADLLRAASTSVPTEVAIRDISATIGLAAGYLVLALWLYGKVERRVRFDGSITSL